MYDQVVVNLKKNFFDRQQRKNMKMVGVLKLVSVHDPVQSLPNKVANNHVFHSRTKHPFQFKIYCHFDLEE